MPIYEYRCNYCGNEEEVLQKITDSPLSICQKCGKNGMEKIISATQFQLKGTGWYVTDFKNSGAKKEPGISKEAKESDDTKTAKDKATSSDSE